MRKPKLSKKLVKTKWLILALSFLLIVVVYRTIDTKSLNNSAIVIGIGIDMSEDKMFEITTQVISVKGSVATGNTETDYVCYTENAPTISECIDRISQRAGLTVSLTHCDVVFLSEKVLNLDHVQLFEPLTGPYYMPEKALVVSGNMSPKDMLSKRVASTTTSTFHLQQTLSEQDGIKSFLSDFMAKSRAKSETVVLPYITVTKMNSQPINDTDEIKDNYEFRINNIIAFNKTDYVVIPTELAEPTSIFLTQNIFQSIHEVMPNGQSVQFKINDKSLDTKVEGNKIIGTLKLNLAYLEAQHVNTKEVINENSEVVNKAKELLEKEIIRLINKSYDFSRKNNIDYFQIKTYAFQKYGHKLDENAFETFEFEPRVQISVEEHK